MIYADSPEAKNKRALAMKPMISTPITLRVDELGSRPSKKEEYQRSLGVSAMSYWGRSESNSCSAYERPLKESNGLNFLAAEQL